MDARPANENENSRQTGAIKGPKLKTQISSQCADAFRLVREVRTVFACSQRKTFAFANTNPLKWKDMDEQPIGTLAYSDLKADVYSTSLPGEFKVIYRDSAGSMLAEESLTGVSTYRQREPDILGRLQQLSERGKLTPGSELADSGEY